MTRTATRRSPIAVVGVIFLCVLLLVPAAHGASLYNLVSYTNSSCVVRTEAAATVAVANSCTSTPNGTLSLYSEPVTGTCFEACPLASLATFVCNSCLGNSSSSTRLKIGCNATHADFQSCSSDTNCSSCDSPFFTYALQSSASCPNPILTPTAYTYPCKYVVTRSYSTATCSASLLSTSYKVCDQCSSTGTYLNCSVGDSSSLGGAAHKLSVSLVASLVFGVIGVLL